MPHNKSGSLVKLAVMRRHGCMAKIGEPWLGPARLLERQGLIVLQHCLSGHYAARLTPTGAEVLSTWQSCAESAASWSTSKEFGGWVWDERTLNERRADSAVPATRAASSEGAIVLTKPELPVTASGRTFCTSLQRSGIRFFIQKIQAVTSGGMCST